MTCPRCAAGCRVPGETADMALTYTGTTPSWFLPFVIWFFVAAVGCMSGFLYGYWKHRVAIDREERRIVSARPDEMLHQAAHDAPSRDGGAVAPAREEETRFTLS